jgi:hypothetical protein
LPDQQGGFAEGVVEKEVEKVSTGARQSSAEVKLTPPLSWCYKFLEIEFQHSNLSIPG